MRQNCSKGHSLTAVFIGAFFVRKLPLPPMLKRKGGEFVHSTNFFGDGQFQGVEQAVPEARRQAEQTQHNKPWGSSPKNTLPANIVFYYGASAEQVDISEYAPEHSGEPWTLARVKAAIFAKHLSLDRKTFESIERAHLVGDSYEVAGGSIETKEPVDWLPVINDVTQEFVTGIENNASGSEGVVPSGSDPSTAWFPRKKRKVLNERADQSGNSSPSKNKAQAADAEPSTSSTRDINRDNHDDGDSQGHSSSAEKTTVLKSGGTYRALVSGRISFDDVEPWRRVTRRNGGVEPNCLVGGQPRLDLTLFEFLWGPLGLRPNCSQTGAIFSEVVARHAKMRSAKQEQIPCAPLLKAPFGPELLNIWLGATKETVPIPSILNDDIWTNNIFGWAPPSDLWLLNPRVGGSACRLLVEGAGAMPDGLFCATPSGHQTALQRCVRALIEELRWANRTLIFRRDRDGLDGLSTRQWELAGERQLPLSKGLPFFWRKKFDLMRHVRRANHYWGTVEALLDAGATVGLVQGPFERDDGHLPRSNSVRAEVALHRKMLLGTPVGRELVARVKAAPEPVWSDITAEGLLDP